MSCSIVQDVVVGVSLDKLFRVEPYQEQVTRYNQETGKPFQQTVTKKRFFWCGSQVDEPRESSPDELVSEFCKNLGVFSSGEPARCRGYDHSQYVVGVTVATIPEPGDVFPISQNAIESAMKTVAENLPKYHEEIQLYLVSYIGG